MFDWKDVLSVKVDDILQDEGDTQLQIQHLYEKLKTESIDSSDENCTVENLIHLFKLSQLVMQYVSHLEFDINQHHIARRAKNSLLEETKDDIKGKDVLLREQEIELKHRKEGQYSTDMKHMQDELVEMEKKYDLLVRDVEAAEDALEQERLSYASLQNTSRDDKSKIKNLEDTNKRIEANLRETKMQLSTQRGRLQYKNSDEDAQKNVIVQKNAEIKKYVEEIQALSSENNQMSIELEEITYELEASLIEIEKTSEDKEILQANLHEAEEKIENLIDERDALRIRVEDLSDKIDGKNAEFETKLDEVEKKLAKSKLKCKALEVEKSRQDFELKEHKETIQTIKNDDDAAQLRELKRELFSKDKIIADLHQQLDESVKDFEMLAKDWHRFDMNAAVQQSASSETPKMDSSKASLKEKISMFRARRKEDTENIKVLVGQIADREAIILTLEQEVANLQSGAFGLKDAIHEIKHLKLVLKTEENKVDAFAKQISDLEAQGADLAEENFLLRSKLELPPTQLDISNFKRVNAVELERIKSLNYTLQSEIDKMEEERLALKSQLRLRALEKGEKAVDLALDAVDLYSLEEYADALRTGDYQNMAMRPTLNNSVINKLLNQLENRHADLKDIKANYAIQEKKLSESLAECEVLENAIMEMSRAMLDNGSVNADETKAFSFPQLQLLITMIQAKYNMENPKIISTLKGIELSKANMLVRKQISTLENECTALKKKLDINQVEIERKNSEIDALGKELQLTKENKRGISKLEKPSEELISSSIGFSMLLEQLIDSLAELEDRGIKLKHSNILVEDYTKKFLPLCVKIRLLYRDFAISKSMWAEKVETTQKNEQIAIGDKESLLHEIRLLQECLSNLELPKESLQKRYIDSQRKLIVFEVNQMNLNRRIVALETCESNLKKEISILKHNFQEIDQAARQTISRIYSQKKEALIVSNDLSDKYSQSVPLKSFKALENKLELYISKTKLLMVRETNQIDIRTEHENYRIKAEQLAEIVDKLTSTLQEYQLKAEKFDDIVSSTVETGDYLADSYWRPRYASLTVKAEVLENRAKLAEQKLQVENETEKMLKNQLENMEKQYIEAKDEVIRANEEKLQVLNEYEGGATRKEFEETHLSLAELKATNEDLQSKCEKLSTLSDIAVSQASHIKLQQEHDKQEINLLQAALKDLQMHDDTKLIMGQLHQHILFLQKSENTAKKDASELKTKTLRLEKMVIELEGDVSLQNKTIFELRISTKNRLLILLKTVADYRQRLNGSITLEKHERTCNLVRRLSNINLEFEKKIEILENEKHAIESTCDKLKSKSDLYDELSESIKDSGSNIEKRLQGWHARIAELHHLQLRSQREVQREREKFIALKESSESNSKRLEQLEDLVVQLQNESDLKMMEWQSQQTAYENSIALFEEERDRIYLTTNANEVRELLPDRNLPIGEQLEISIRLLIERSRENKLLQIKNDQLEYTVKENGKAIQHSSHLLNVANLELHKTQALLESKQREENEEFEQKREGALTDKSRIREAKALHFAHETTMSLQRQLNQKNELIQKYRDMLKKIRSDLAEQISHKDVQIEDLQKKLQALTMREIHRVQEIPEKSDGYTKERDYQMEVEMVAELQKLVDAKEVALQSIKQEIEQLYKVSNFEKEAFHQQICQLEEQLAMATEREVSLEETISSMQAELSQAKEIISRPAVKDLSEVVSRMQGDIDAKHQKILAMKKAISTLKAQLLTVSKELEESKINETLGPASNPEEIIIQQRLAARIAQLESKNKKSHESMERAKKENDDLELDNQRLSDELILKRSEISNVLLQNEALKSALSNMNPAVAKAGHSIDEVVKRLEVQMSRVNPGSKGLANNWDIEKTNQKKIESLKEKLKQKTTEAESLLSTNTHLKENISRSERDRLRLQKKVQKLMDDKETPKSTNTTAEPPTDLALLSAKNTALQQALAKANRKLASKYHEIIPASVDINLQELSVKTNDELISIVSSLKSKEQKANEFAKEISSLQAELQGAIEREKAAKESVSHVAKLDEVNTKLRSKLRKETERAKIATDKSDELSVANEQLIKDIVSLRKLITGVPDSQANAHEQAMTLDSLKKTLQEKEKLIQELLSNPDKNEGSRLTSENRRLKRELEMWQLRVTKLSNADPKPLVTNTILYEENERLKAQLKLLTEEVEDLHFNYKDLVRKSVVATLQ